MTQAEQFAKLQIMNYKIDQNSNFDKFQVPNGCCFIYLDFFQVAQLLAKSNNLAIFESVSLVTQI